MLTEKEEGAFKPFPRLKPLSWGNASPEQVLEHRKLLHEWYDAVYQWRMDTKRKLQKRMEKISNDCQNVSSPSDFVACLEIGHNQLLKELLECLK